MRLLPLAVWRQGGLTEALALRGEAREKEAARLVLSRFHFRLN